MTGDILVATKAIINAMPTTISFGGTIWIKEKETCCLEILYDIEAYQKKKTKEKKVNSDVFYILFCWKLFLNYAYLCISYGFPSSVLKKDFYKYSYFSLDSESFINVLQNRSCNARCQPKTFLQLFLFFFHFLEKRYKKLCLWIISCSSHRERK